MNVIFVGTGEQLHVPVCIFDKVNGMCFALIPGLTFAPVRMYQFFRLGSPIYQGRHLITELMSDIGQCVILIFYNIKPGGKQYHLNTLMGLREAGEMHHDLQWRLTCLRRRLGTARRRRQGYYKKVSYEEAQESFGRHHPAFVEGWWERFVRFYDFTSKSNPQL